MPKAKTSRPKSATKSRASTKRNTAVKSKTSSKAVAPRRKGVRHHAKRLYHATPKFVHGMIVGGLVGVLVVGFVGGSAAIPSMAHAATGTPVEKLSSCTVKTDANSTFSVSGGNVTATFTVAGACASQAVSLVSWEAPNGTTGQPYSSQTLFSHTTGTFKPGVYHLTVALPNCYYQVDLITGSNPTDSTGGSAYAKEGILRRSLHGGTQTCSPTVTTLPKVPVTEASQTTTLPNTGPAALFIVVGLAIVGGYVFHMTHHHVKKRRHAAHHAR